MALVSCSHLCFCWVLPCVVPPGIMTPLNYGRSF